MFIGKTSHFDAAHYLPGHPKCGVMHGHTWTLEVMISGKSFTNLGSENMVLDFHTLSDVTKEVIRLLDHTCLNNIIAYPTVENLARHLQSEINLQLYSHGSFIVHIRLQEGQGGYADTRSLS